MPLSWSPDLWIWIQLRKEFPWRNPSWPWVCRSWGETQIYTQSPFSEREGSFSKWTLMRWSSQPSVFETPFDPPCIYGTPYFAFSHWSLCTWHHGQSWCGLFRDIISLGLRVQIFTSPVPQCPNHCLSLGHCLIIRNYPLRKLLPLPWHPFQLEHYPWKVPKLKVVVVISEVCAPKHICYVILIFPVHLDVIGLK